MQKVQLGESRCLGELYERHKLALFQYFYRSTSDKAKSEDLVQNVFMRVLKYKHHFKGQGGVNYWLFGIARNVLYDTAKRKDPLHYAQEINHDKMEGQYQMQSTHALSKEAKVQKLHKALEMISPDKKDAIILSRYNGLDYRTIAEMSNCSESAIKVRVMRGLSEIKELVKTIEL